MTETLAPSGSTPAPPHQPKRTVRPGTLLRRHDDLVVDVEVAGGGARPDSPGRVPGLAAVTAELAETRPPATTPPRRCCGASAMVGNLSGRRVAATLGGRQGRGRSRLDRDFDRPGRSPPIEPRPTRCDQLRDQRLDPVADRAAGGTDSSTTTSPVRCTPISGSWCVRSCSR